MKKLITIIEEKMQKAFAEAGYEEKFGRVSVSNRPDLCEYQSNGALMAAKQYKCKPIDIATKVTEVLKNDEAFINVDAVMPGFINFSLNQKFLSDYLMEMAGASKFGCLDLGEGKTIVIDYGGPNVAKPLHVGHLRPAIIGESIKRIKKYAGYNVIGDVHLGDWGLQMGLIIASMKELYPDMPFFAPDYNGEEVSEVPFTVSDLEVIYPNASKRSKEDEAFKEAAHEATKKLQEYDKGHYALWKKIIDISVNDLKQNYKKLDVDFELWNGESDAQPYIPDMVKMMKEGGFAVESQGALVVDVSKEDDKKEIPPCIITKSDGASLYSTTDLATLVEREEKYKPVQVIYVVDKRQEMHFTQVFRCARKTGIVRPETELTYIGFGTMNGPDGKPFKTRDGGVMRLENLIGDINDAVYNKMSKQEGMSDEERREIADIVGLAALKYGDLSNQAAKDYVFDVERFTEFEGNTGPYNLYMMVRITSILRKYKAASGATDEDIKSYVINPAGTDAEKKLQRTLSTMSDTIEAAAVENAPHKICQYIYSIADSFSSFYHDVNIMNEPDEAKKKGYIKLITLTHEILADCINLLGFKEPERM